jgi:hypothetical protein
MAKHFLSAASKAKFRQVVVIGGQPVQSEIFPRPESAEIESIAANFADANAMQCTVVRLPYFLENLLWFTEAVARDAKVVYPVLPHVIFPFISCEDAGHCIAKLLLTQNVPSVVELSGGLTTMQEVCRCLSQKHAVQLQVCDLAEFKRLLISQGNGAHGAEEIYTLWQLLSNIPDAAPYYERQRDVQQATNRLLEQEAISVSKWAAQHQCCFNLAACAHPHPPRPHAATSTTAPQVKQRL